MPYLLSICHKTQHSKGGKIPPLSTSTPQNKIIDNKRCMKQSQFYSETCYLRIMGESDYISQRIRGNIIRLY
jgi:hypothetical protein